MNSTASVGPVHFVALTYFVCIIVALGVAWFIRLLFSGIRWQRHIAHAHAIAEIMVRKKDMAGKKD